MLESAGFLESHDPPADVGQEDSSGVPEPLAAGELSIAPVAELAEVEAADVLSVAAVKKGATQRKKPQPASNETALDEDLVSAYLKEIRRYPLLTKDEEVVLAKQVQAGLAARASLGKEAGELSRAEARKMDRTIREGERAKELFVNSNLRLVVSVAKKYTPSGLPLLDLIQEGNLGLMHAVDKFKWQKGFKFSTYATWWIRQAISRGIVYSRNDIRMSVNASDDILLLTRTQERLKSKGGSASVADLADELEWPTSKINDVVLWRKRQATVSLDEPIGVESSSSASSLNDLLADPTAGEGYEQVERAAGLADEIAERLAVLNPHERRTIKKRFGLEGEPARSLEEIAEETSVTRQAVSATLKRALKKLQDTKFQRQNEYDEE